MKKYFFVNLVKYILFVFFNVNIICLQQIHGFPATLSVNDLNGTNGFSVSGKTQEDRSGRSVKKAGDINGDKIDDFIIGAIGVDYNNLTNCGQAYVVFGTGKGFPVDLQLNTLNGINGFAITPVNLGSNLSFGISVSDAGDVNGDGFADVIIGGGDKAFIIFGQNAGFPANFDASQLNGLNGFTVVYTLNNNPYGDGFGHSVSGAGDVNGDGIDDMIIGAPYYCDNASLLKDGRGYIIFGSKSGFPAIFDVKVLNGLNGFTVTGYHDEDVNYEDLTASQVRNLGDVNGDKIDDLIIASGSDGQIEIGHCYVVFGRKDAFPTDIQLHNLNGIDGFIIHGETYEDGAGTAAGWAGDVNGDGINDMIVSEYGYIKLGQQVGKVCVVFGQPVFPADFYLAALNGINGFSVIGEFGTIGLGYNEVSGIGDINADGLGDIIASPAVASLNDKAYIVFGNDTFPVDILVNTLNGLNGFTVTSKDNSIDNFGDTLNGAGDVNGDGVDDFIIGAAFQSPQNIKSAGQSYVILGEQKVIGDVDGDNQADLILQKPYNLDYPKGLSMIYAALMTNGYYTGIKTNLALLPTTAEKVVAVNDFDLDGVTDLATQNGTLVQLRTGPGYGVVASFSLPASLNTNFNYHVIGSGNIRGMEVKGKKGYPELIIVRSATPPIGTNYYYKVNQGNWSFGAIQALYTNSNGLYPVVGAGRFIASNNQVNRYDEVMMYSYFASGINKDLFARQVSFTPQDQTKFLMTMYQDEVLGAANFKVGNIYDEFIWSNSNNVYFSKWFSCSAPG